MKSSIKYIFLAAILLWCYCPLFAQIEIVIAPNVQKSLSAAKKCGENVTIAFQIKEWYGNLQQRWLANQNLKVDLLEGNKVVSSSKLQSDNEGRLVVSGTLKESGTLTCRISLVDEWENKVIWTKDVTSVQFGDAKNTVAKTTSQIAEKQTSPKLSSDKPAANEAKQDAPSVPVQTELPVPNLSGFKDEVCHLFEKNLIVNPGFEEPLDQEKNVWKFDGKDLNVFKVVPGAGGNGSRALLCKRPDQDEKLYWATQQVNNITSGANFVLKCKIKVTGSNGKESAKFGFTGNLQRTLVGDCDWTEYEVICTSSDRKIYPTFSALSGEVSYDDIRLQEFNGTWFVGMLNPYNRIEDNERIMYFTATCQGQHVYTKTATPDIAVLIEVQNQSGETVLSACRRIVDNRFCVDGSKLADGIYKLKISFIDLANKSIFDRAFRPLYVGTSKLPKAPAKGVVTIDKLGRTLIDGKPFMPLAIHTAGVGRQYDVKYFANSPFNAVLVYSGYSDLYMREYKGYGVAGTLKSLDMMHKNGLKVIFGFPFTYEEHMKEFRTQMQRWGFPDNLSAEEYIGKVVDEVRNHPAILAYYSTDEISHLRAAELMSHRDVINAHDPYHPTYAGIWQHFAFPYFSGTFDVLGINLYPIQGKDKPQEQPQLPLWINKAHKVWDRPDTLAVPLWATHQLFSGSLIDDPRKDLKNYRFPTEMELLSMTLMSAIHGAKGFVYYYWNCVLYSCGSTLDEKCETFQPHWRDICRALTEVRELEPFIVSTAPAPKVTVNNIKGITYARAFVDEEYGRIRVLISAEGPGEAEAEIKIEDFPIPLGAHDNLLRSKYNKTSRIDKNTYIFKGREVDCDILQRWPEYELDKPIIEMEKERKEKAGK